MNRPSKPELDPILRTEITRDRLRSGVFDQMIAELGDVPMRDKAERDQLRREFLAARRADEALWVFAYGSLIWNPAFHHSGRQAALLHGYHRAFCIWTYVGRGTREHPGLMLGLDRGGACRGLAYRLTPQQAEEECEVIWDREMLIPVYQPRWVTIRVDGRPVRAMTFVVDHSFEQYSGRLAYDDTARHLAQGEGVLGSSLEYLQSLVESLAAAGLPDQALSKLLSQALRYKAGG